MPLIDGAQVGVEIHDDAVTRTVYATDNSIYQVEPAAVAIPRTADEVAALVAANHADPRPRPVVARGGGTGTNGQSLTDGLVVDCKRGLDRILSIDPAARTAVVQPGVVTAALNAELATHGLFWAPHTSTLNRATVGGMIATDAAGKGSLVHGRAHRHVLALDVVLDDGTPWRAEALTVAEAEARATVDDRIGRLWGALLALPLAEGDDHGLPPLARGFSGYGIDRVRRGDLIDPVPLLCGAEGTLAITTAATIQLTPIPAHTVLVVASYRSFDDALLDAVDVAVTKPTAIESFDETTLERGRSSPAWPALGSVVGADAGSVLLLEYTGDDEIDLEPIVDTLARTGRSQATRAVHDPVERAAAWKVRADAVGLLAKVATGGPERSARPTAFVEDCAVPVREMPAFIAGFRRILDDAGLTYGMFGHADVGCVHVRPALDLTDPEHEQLVRRITDDVTALVAWLRPVRARVSTIGSRSISSSPVYSSNSTEPASAPTTEP
ncbi:MAG: FAD-binding oxidoreductase, partial [Actinomycetota bacterium]